MCRSRRSEQKQSAAADPLFAAEQKPPTDLKKNQTVTQEFVS